MSGDTMSVETVVSEQRPDVANVVTRDGRSMLMISRAEFNRIVDTRKEARAEAEDHRKRADKAEVREGNWQIAFYVALAFALSFGLGLIAEVSRWAR